LIWGSGVLVPPTSVPGPVWLPIRPVSSGDRVLNFSLAKSTGAMPSLNCRSRSAWFWPPWNVRSESAWVAAKLRSESAFWPAAVRSSPAWVPWCPRAASAIACWNARSWAAWEAVNSRLIRDSFWPRTASLSAWRLSHSHSAMPAELRSMLPVKFIPLLLLTLAMTKPSAGAGVGMVQS
jgi:hypothetical protein